MSELHKPPQKKINWLKRLKLEFDDDDDDSSDATPQRMEPGKTDENQQKKSAVKARLDDEAGGVAVENTKRKRKESNRRIEKKQPRLGKDNEEESPESRRRPHKQSKSEERQQRLHHGSGSEKHLAKSHNAMTVGALDGDGRHRTKSKEQEGKMAQRKRSHVERAVVEKRGEDQLAVDRKPEVPVDPDKVKAAASRQRRMRKLQARRKATGEHDRLTAIKLKRQESLEASRLKRNQRGNTRKTGKAVAAANKNGDANNETEPRPRSTPKVGEVANLEFQQIANQNGEGEKDADRTPLSPKDVTNGAVKSELGSMKTYSGQTEEAKSSGDQTRSERKQDLSRDQVVKMEVQEEGQVNPSVLVSGVSAETTETQSGNEKNIRDEKKDMMLDMMPIPRKSSTRGRTAENASSFVIPKRSAIGQAEDYLALRAINPLEAPIPVLMKPLPSPKSSPQFSIREPIRSQRKRKKNPVPVKNSVLSAEDRALMRLGRKRNSIFMAAIELAAQPSACEGPKKLSTIRMMGYEVLGTDGKVLPDLIPRLSCATKSEMSSAKGSFDASFFGVSLSVPKAKGDNCSTEDECGGGVCEVRKMSCYEELQFERPEDRGFYQRRMYGTTFAPQRLRGRTTLIVRSARFERKSTGIRFNQDRDREEFAASMSKRYTFNKSVPRCNIPRENWQKLMRNQPSTVYLHYYNREDAERASYVFHDDLGNPLELRLEYKAGVVISRSSSPAPAGRSNRVPGRSCSSERCAPEPSPLSSYGGSARSTPHRGRERQRAANGDYQYSRYDRPPPAQFNGGEDRYGSSPRGSKRPSAHSRPRSRHGQQHDLGAAGTEVGTVAGAEPLLLSEKSKEKMAPGAHEYLSGNTEGDYGDSHTTSTFVPTKNDKVAESSAKKPAAFTMAPLLSQSATSKSDNTREQEVESDEEGQEEGEIENSAVDLPKPAAPGDDRKILQSPPRHWQQPNDMQIRQRQGDVRGDPRDYSRDCVQDYRPYDNRGPDRRRSRSRSRPRPSSAPWHGDGRDDGWDEPYSKEYHRSRDFGPIDPYEVNDRDRRMYSGSMDRYGGRGYRGNGDYNGRRGDAYSRQY